MDLHEIVSAVKQLAIELGRTPTRVDFEQNVRNAHTLLARFGGMSAVLQAAGLETYNERRIPKRFSKADLYGADIAEVVEAHIPKVTDSHAADFAPILCVGDTHFPFAHQPTLERIYRFAEKEQPAHIIQMGDLLDQWAHSRFPASRNYYRPDEEMELGRKQAQTFWDEIKKACPNAKLHLLTGNHDERAIKLVLGAAPTLESFVRQGIRELYKFDGVNTIKDYRDHLEIQGVMFHHGVFGRAGQHRDYALQNIVTAHTHRGSVTYRPFKGKTLWHLDCGYTGDEHAKALCYTPTKVTNWTLGWGFIDSHGPRFVPA